MVIIFSLFFCLLFFGKPIYSQNYSFSLLKTIFSFIGAVLFYFTDYYVLSLCEHYYPSNYKNTVVKGFFFSIMFWLLGKVIYSYGLYFNLLVMFNFFICYILGAYEEKNFTGPLVYLLVFVAPLSTLFGLDPIWKDQYSFFSMSSEILSYYYIIFGVLIVFYLSYKKRSFEWSQQN